MIYITGDIHANQRKWVAEIEPHLIKGDVLIVAGDFGYGFWDDIYWPQEMFFDHIAEQEYIVLFIDGNHEHFDKLNALPESTWNGGKVHFIRDNVIHLMRGQIFEIEGVSIFTMGGGFSLDKARRTPGISWFKQEMPSDEEYVEAEAYLCKHGNMVDYIVSHTCPTESVEYLATYGGHGISKNVLEERKLTSFLQSIANRVEYKKWFFGHFHIDKEIWKNQIAIFNTIRELETGKIIHQWDQYEG